jgi:hypothetical protein
MAVHLSSTRPSCHKKYRLVNKGDFESRRCFLALHLSSTRPSCPQNKEKDGSIKGGGFEIHR